MTKGINFSQQSRPGSNESVLGQVRVDQNLLVKLKPSATVIVTPNKCSFKDSFVDSDNFLNIEEKPEEGTFSNSTLANVLERDIKQKSLNQLIKEKFLGPIIANHGGNSQSFLRRNILLTTSNYSNKSSMVSIKSSFI